VNQYYEELLYKDEQNNYFQIFVKCTWYLLSDLVTYPPCKEPLKDGLITATAYNWNLWKSISGWRVIGLATRD